MAAVDFFSNQVRTSFLFFIDIKSPMRRSFDIYGRRKILWDVESTSFVKLLWFPLFVNTRLKIFNYRISFFVVLLTEFGKIPTGAVHPNIYCSNIKHTLRWSGGKLFVDIEEQSKVTTVLDFSCLNFCRIYVERHMMPWWIFSANPPASAKWLVLMSE